MGEPMIWIDGRLTHARKGMLSAYDHGVTVGDGIFEAMKIVRDDSGELQAFALTRHLARLRRSAAGLGLTVTLTDNELRAAVRAVLDANGPEMGRVRLTMTGGVGVLGSERSGAAPTFIVASSECRVWEKPAGVALVPWRRNEFSALAGLKTTSYAENVVALQHAQERGASEAIFANTAGRLCEGTGSNVFVGLDGRLLTPPLSSGCLAGITRELLLEIVDVVEEDLPLDALAGADEAFLASTLRDVQPIIKVDDTTMTECPGPLTRGAVAAFAALVSRSSDP
jgi:branched-chain amino acid aminotransferase